MVGQFYSFFERRIVRIRSCRQCWNRVRIVDGIDGNGTSEFSAIGACEGCQLAVDQDGDRQFLQFRLPSKMHTEGHAETRDILILGHFRALRDIECCSSPHAGEGADEACDFLAAIVEQLQKWTCCLSARRERNRAPLFIAIGGRLILCDEVGGRV